jgi:hypothetical protein
MVDGYQDGHGQGSYLEMDGPRVRLTGTALIIVLLATIVLPSLLGFYIALSKNTSMVAPPPTLTFKDLIEHPVSPLLEIHRVDGDAAHSK